MRIWRSNSPSSLTKTSQMMAIRLDTRMWRKFKANLSRRTFWEGFHSKITVRRENLSSVRLIQHFCLDYKRKNFFFHQHLKNQDLTRSLKCLPSVMDKSCGQSVLIYEISNEIFFNSFFILHSADTCWVFLLSLKGFFLENIWSHFYFFYIHNTEM